MNTRGHEIEVTPVSDQVVVRVKDVVVATSSRPIMLTETGCPPRYYLPSADVKAEIGAEHAQCHGRPVQGVGGHAHPAVLGVDLLGCAPPADLFAHGRGRSVDQDRCPPVPVGLQQGQQPQHPGAGVRHVVVLPQFRSESGRYAA
jgi:Domain of unknown function (DUF427)